MSRGFKTFLLTLTVYLGIDVYPIFAGVQPELKFHVDELSRISKGNLVLTKVRFGILGKEVLGICNTRYKTITINRSSWEVRTFEEQIIILAHEAGHCLKELNHDKDWGGGVCPDSFMYYRSMGGWCAIEYWDQYVKEMGSM